MKATTENNNILHYFIFLLYMVVPLIKNIGAFDYATTQWLYLGGLNFVVFVFFIVNRAKYFSFKLSLPVKVFFLLQVGLLFFSLISISQSIIVSESLINLAELFTFIISIFIVFVLFINSKINFFYIALITTIFLCVEVLETLYYFFSKYNTIRTSELLAGIPHRYGNRNVLAVSMAIKFPFVLYVFYHLKGLKKFIGLFAILSSIVAVFLIGARSAVLIIAFSLILFAIAFFVDSKFHIKKTVITIGLLLLSTLAAVYISTLPNKTFESKNNSINEIFFTQRKQDIYTTKTVGLNYGSGRSSTWEAAFNDFKNKPFFGNGIGNWKYTPKEPLLKAYNGRGFVSFTHVHNDFLQVLAEVGIFGFLCYLFGFILAIFLCVKLIIERDKNIMIYSTLLVGVLSYLVDAFLNFPHDRTPIQALLAILLALILYFTWIKSSTVNLNAKFSSQKKYILFGLVVILLSALVIHKKDYSASVVQLKLMTQIQNNNAYNGDYNISYNKVKTMLDDDFPYINQAGMTNDDVKALFAASEKKYTIALKHLNVSEREAPNNYYSKSVKAQIFDRIKNEDSTFYYSKLVFDKLPAYKSNFLLLNNYYNLKKDSVNILETYNQYLKKRPVDRVSWTHYAEAIRTYKRNDKLALNKIDSILQFYPRDENLLNYKKELVKVMSGPIKAKKTKTTLNEDELKKRSDLYNLGNKLFDESKFEASKSAYLKVLEIESSNIASKYKLGLVEVKLKNYTKAIEYLEQVITTNLIKDGKPEYNIGFCYFKLNKIEKAKANFTKSYHKGFPLAKNLDPRMLNL